MSTYSVRIFAGPLPIADMQLYTVPAGHTLVLRDVEMYNYSNAAASFSLSVLVAGTSNQHAIQYIADATVSSHQWEGRIVLEGGDILQGHCTSTSNFIYISGYDLQ